MREAVGLDQRKTMRRSGEGKVRSRLVIFSLLVLSLVCIYCTTTAQADWTILGPDGASINSLMVDSQTPSTLYAVTDKGAFKSINGGSNWFPVNSALIDLGILSFAVDPDHSNTLYAITRPPRIPGPMYPTWVDLHKSTDGGDTWTWVTKIEGTFYIDAIMIKDGTPYAVYDPYSSGKALFKISNDGVNWTKLNLDLTNRFITFLTAAPTTASSPQGIIYAGVEDHSSEPPVSTLYKSPDNGDTWTELSLDETDPPTSINSFAITPHNSQTLYAGTEKGVFKSENGGDTWRLMEGLDTTNRSVHDIAIDSGALYAELRENGTSESQLFKTSDDGATPWLPVSLDLNGTSVTTIAAASEGASKALYVGTGDGIFKSTNDGDTWETAHKGIPAAAITSFAVDPDDPNAFYAGTDNGVFRSTDGGDNWTRFNLDTSYTVDSLVIDSGALYAQASNDGLFKSTDRGETWSKLDVNGGEPYSVYCLVNDPSTHTLYAGTEGGVFKGTDGGTNWTMLSLGDTQCCDNRVSSIAVDLRNSNTIYVATLEGAFKSIDGGETWAWLFNPVGPGFHLEHITTLAIDTQDPDIVYAGTFITVPQPLYTYGGSVYKSVNGGKSWNKANSPNHPIKSIAIDPRSPRILYAATIADNRYSGASGGGVIKSIDESASWFQVNSGLTDLSVNSFAIDPQNSEILYAATNSGVFRSVDGGGSSPHAPGAPTNVTATLRKVFARAKNAQAIVSFTPPVSESGITRYTVTSNPGNITVTGRRNRIRVTGLTLGTTYTFTVAATNKMGITGSSSGSSNAVTPARAPDAPNDVIAAAGANGEATVAFTAPSDGGSPITSYTVYTVKGPRGITARGAASPITVTGLTAGKVYTFRVQATNAMGTGRASRRSNKITAR